MLDKISDQSEPLWPMVRDHERFKPALSGEPHIPRTVWKLFIAAAYECWITDYYQTEVENASRNCFLAQMVVVLDVLKNPSVPVRFSLYPQTSSLFKFAH